LKEITMINLRFILKLKQRNTLDWVDRYYGGIVRTVRAWDTMSGMPNPAPRMI
jgi:hypothetical protein